MEELEWTPDLMLEVGLSETDDFLKVRETLSRIGIASRKERKLISLVTFFTNKADTL